jgi:hypothetical protein
MAMMDFFLCYWIYQMRVYLFGQAVELPHVTTAVLNFFMLGPIQNI